MSQAVEVDLAGEEALLLAEIAEAAQKGNSLAVIQAARVLEFVSAERVHGPIW
jgi:hypothetical protein